MLNSGYIEDSKLLIELRNKKGIEEAKRFTTTFNTETNYDETIAKLGTCFDIDTIKIVCHNQELKQIYDKQFLDYKYFVHNDTRILIEYIEHNISSEEYAIKIKKAYNCLVQEKQNFKILFLHSDDIYTDLASPMPDFITTRPEDLNNFLSYYITQDKLKNDNKLFKDIVMRFAKESKCLSKQVAAIAVKEGRIILTGINGTAPKLENCNDYFKAEYNILKQKTIIQKDMTFDEWIKTPEWKKIHHQWSLINEIHAEQSLLIKAAESSANLTDCDIYTSLQPCIHCAKMLASLKPKHIFYIEKYTKSDESSIKLLNKRGIIIKQI